VIFKPFAQVVFTAVMWNVANKQSQHNDSPLRKVRRSLADVFPPDCSILNTCVSRSASGHYSLKFTNVLYCLDHLPFTKTEAFGTTLKNFPRAEDHLVAAALGRIHSHFQNVLTSFHVALLSPFTLQGDASTIWSRGHISGD
jgi:hypothetical protein